MDQIKIGNFLKELRKEKSFTQEQLAEHFNISSRTVFRWENGNNMPDISVSIELSEFYDVDIREIINGEMKGKNMNNEIKDTLVKVAEYTGTEKTRFLKRVFIGTIITILSVFIAIVLLAYGIGEEYGIAMYFSLGSLWRVFFKYS